MPNKTVGFFHQSVQTPSPAPVLGTTFNTADVHVHDLLSGAVPFVSSGPVRGRLEALHIHLHNIAGGAANVDVKVCLDANGNNAFVPTTRCPIDAAITTAGHGNIALKVGIPLVAITSSTYYVFAKLDAGTADYVTSILTWTEV